MTAIRISSTQLARQIGEILGRVRFSGEHFVVERNGEPVAVLAPYEERRKRTLGELIEQMKQYPADPEWSQLLLEIRDADRPPKDPWGSS